MVRWWRMGLPVLFTVVLTGCNQPPKSTSHPQHPLQPQPKPQTVFFAGVQKPYADLLLRPDPFVQKEFPGVTLPAETVIVRMPVYPGAVSAKPHANIGDMGTPMVGTLVDGTLYFQSTDSQTQIQSWYTHTFQKLGYQMGGEGQTQDHGKLTSSFFALTKNGAPGSPTKWPDISLGFLAQKEGNETIFELKAQYILHLVRPKDSYVPTDIVKVVLTDGKSTKTVTDGTWISRVVGLINGLDVSLPAMSAGPGVGPGSLKTFRGTFYEESGTGINVVFSLPFDTVSVGNSTAHLDGTAALITMIQSVFKP